MIVYKVKDPQTGLYQDSGGGFAGHSNWSKKGKTWSTAGHLRQHFAQMRKVAGYPTGCTFDGKHFTQQPHPDPISNMWVVEEFAVTPQKIGQKPALDFMEKK